MGSLTDRPPRLRSEGASFRRTVTLCSGASLGVFLFDAFTPLGVAGAVPYVFVIWLSRAFPRQRHTAMTALICSALTAVGALLSDPSAHLNIVLLNRTLALASIWLFVLLVGQYRSSKAVLSDVIGGLPSSVIAVNAAGTILLANKEALNTFGYQASQLIGQPLEKLLPGHLREAHVAHRAQYMAHPGVRRMGMGRELFAVRQDDSLFPVEVGLSPIVHDGQPLVVASVIDITARHAAEKRAERIMAELKRSNEELDRFAYVASHDLKAPLRAIKNVAAWIEEDLPQDFSPEMRENIGLLQSRVLRMEAFLEGLLQYSRVGREKLEPETISVRDLISDVIELVMPPDEVLVRVLDDLPTIVSSRLPLQQVFMNLLSNAVKHRGDRNVTVEVGATVSGDWVEFRVVDDGPGIEPSMHHKVFEMFQTLKPRDEVEGTGIGLALVKKIVEGRGGQIWLQSEPDQGATFFLTWPVNQARK